MKKLYFNLTIVFIFFIQLLLSTSVFAQRCTPLNTTYITTESRCENTGTVTIDATGGSGNFLYKLDGPISTAYTSSNLILGLAPGNYLVTIWDVQTNCIFATDSISIVGDYSNPTFTMVSTDVTCNNGNDGTIQVTSQSFGRAPFTYTIIAPSPSNVGAVSFKGFFNNLSSGDYLVQLRDSCGGIQTRSIRVEQYDWSISSYIVNRINCDSIDVTIFLKDSRGNISPDTIFNGFYYGASVTTGDTSWFTTNNFQYYLGKKTTVKLFVKDKCGNIKTFIWTNPWIPSVNANVTISNRECSTFTVRIGGQQNLTLPEYCLYDSADVLISCDSTGIFNLLPYGRYCIKIKNTCYDTVITRCFTANKPKPSVSANVGVSSNCRTITATITGQTNLTNPYYCIYDSANVLISCDSSGIFSNLPYGRYCITIKNDSTCYDTLITRCINVPRPMPSVGANVEIVNLECTTFTVRIRDTANLDNPLFCIYTAANVLIVCNNTGVFSNLAYGSYCIRVNNDPACFDTVITRCFTINRPIPSINPTVQNSNFTCTSFRVAIVGQSYINNPKYCLYDSVDALMQCNTTGIFSNLLFGSYCIKVINDSTCYDTVITRCFTVNARNLSVSFAASKSCGVFGTSNLRLNINSGISPYNILLYSPTGQLLQTANTSASNYTFQNMPNLIAPSRYKIVVTDLCGKQDSGYITPNISRFTHEFENIKKCPSSLWPDGSSDVILTITDNNVSGTVTSSIIKKNGAAVSINPSAIAGNVYSFYNLGWGTYIFDTYLNDCDRHVYDTIVVELYIYPHLFGSSAYSCDTSGYSVTVNTNGGIGPHMHEIIGSTPAIPSIISAPQASPSFNINNGVAYSLVRVRTVDACGNAALYDINILPISNFAVYQHNPECFNQSLMLQVDSIANATFTWYKRIVPNDSIVVGTNSILFFPNLSLSDTGRYFCKININNGCMVRIANHTIVGGCYVVLSNPIKLNGVKQEEKNILTWKSGGENVKTYLLQKSATAINFKTIYTVSTASQKQFEYTDANNLIGNNYYRLAIIDKNNRITYSNSVLISHSQSDVSIYPNPVVNDLFINLKNKNPKNYQIELYSINGAKIISNKYTNVGKTTITYPISPAVMPGIYTLIITELQTNEKQIFKIIRK